MKSEEKSIKAISAQAHGEAADNRLLRHKLREKDELISDLRAQIENLNRNLSEKVSQMADMMDKLVAFMMGRGDVTLSDTLRDAVIAGVRAEYEMRERKLKEEFSKQLGNLTSEFEARLAAKDNEINALKGEDGGEGGNTPSTSLPKDSVTVTPEEMAARNKQLEQQKANLQVSCHGLHTESAKYHHGEQQVENADDLDLNGEDVPDERVVEIAREVKARKDIKGVEKPRRKQPLALAAEGVYYCMTLGDIESWLKGMGLNFAHSTVMNWIEKEEEPELLKAVNYALTEYPCMLHCLEDGSLDLSNNICERQIRRIAKYRNNSFFVGSPKAGVRFARLMSVFANIRNHNLDPVEYLCDVFRRIKNTANDKLVELLAHRWQPATVSSWV